MVVFRVSFQYNESYAFREDPFLTEHQRVHQQLIADMSGRTRAGVRRCESCGEIIGKWETPLAGLVIKKRKYDIAITYDGVIVVSEGFKSQCEASAIIGW